VSERDPVLLRRIYMKQGERVICANPKCQKEIKEAIRNLCEGETIRAEDFKFFNKEKINGMSMKCDDCGTSYYQNNRFHIGQGRWR